MKVAQAFPLVVMTSVSLHTPAFAQDDSPLASFYGKINVSSVLNQPYDGESSSELESNASRVGLAGDYALSDSLTLVYQAEYEVKPGPANFANFSLTQRTSFIGLEGGFGTVLVGRHDTPAREVQSGIDLFNDLDGDFRSLFHSENRPNDQLHYISPTLAGFTVSYAAIIDGQDSFADRLTNSHSASVTYAQGAFLFGVAMENDVAGVDSVRLMSRYRKGNLQLGLLYESAKTARSDGSGVVVSAEYTIDKLVLKAQTGAADQKRQGGSQNSVGVDYNIDQDSRVFAFVTRTRADNRVVDNDQFGVGFEHSF